jgi:NOL1/NOP2/fmu family ribosome biogenesis protein
LDSGAALVRPGGRLVYSTCTFAPAENEQAVAEFLKRHPDFEPETVDAPWFTPAGEGQFRMWPHKLLGEGHFGAVLRRKGEEPATGEGDIGEKLPKLWDAFAKELNIKLPGGKAVTFGSRVFWAPKEMPSLKGLKVLRPGLELGELKKDRFEPAHALALWLKECKCMENLDSDGKQIQEYLCGNVIPSEKKGWCLVTVDSYPIGWGKGDGVQLKNHYPKGLRRFR